MKPLQYFDIIFVLFWCKKSTFSMKKSQKLIYMKDVLSKSPINDPEKVDILHGVGSERGFVAHCLIPLNHASYNRSIILCFT